jgi:hypothetical protein
MNTEAKVTGTAVIPIYDHQLNKITCYKHTKSLPKGKGKKVKLSLCFFLTEHHAMKAYWGVEE